MDILVTILGPPVPRDELNIFIKINWSDCCQSVSTRLQDCRKAEHMFLCKLAPYTYVNMYIYMYSQAH